MHTRKAASVFPEPVGAAISVSRPAAMSRRPSFWGGVGPSGNVRSNPVRTAGWKVSSMPPLYRRPLTTSPAGVERAGPLQLDTNGTLRHGSREEVRHVAQPGLDRLFVAGASDPRDRRVRVPAGGSQDLRAARARPANRVRCHRSPLALEHAAERHD